MKLAGRDAESYFARPDPDRPGVLLFGTDAMRVALKRQQVLAALLGAGAEEEMRLTRIPASDLRQDPAALLDAVKAVGFFPGQRAALVEDATDTTMPAIEAALNDWQSGDAQIVVTAGALKKTSKLRKMFEAHKTAYAAGIYDNPLTRAEIERALSDAGLAPGPQDSMAMLGDLAATLGPGDFRQMIEKIALYKMDDPGPLALGDITACAPLSTEAGLDEILNAAAEQRTGDIGPLLRRLKSQGTTPVSLCIGATRHFRQLYTAAADPGGPGAGAGKLRPPLYGKRRDQIVRQAQAWGAARLELALTQLTDTDLQLRSGGRTVPAMALVERTLIRLSMMARTG